MHALGVIIALNERAEAEERAADAARDNDTRNKRRAKARRGNVLRRHQVTGITVEPGTDHMIIRHKAAG